MKDALKIINQMIFFYATVNSVTGIYGGEEKMPVYGCQIVLLTLGCYLMRRYISKLFLFLLGHLLVAAAGIGVIKFFDLSGGFLAVLLLLLVYSVLLRTLAETELIDEPGYFYLGVLALCFVICVYMGKSERAVNCVMAAFFVTLLLKVIYGNLKATDEFIRNRASSTRIDERRLKRMNNGITLLYTGILAIILIVVRLFRTEGISEMVAGWFRKFLQQILGPLASLSGETEVEITDQAVEQTVPSVAISETSPVWKVLDVVFEVVGTLFVVAGILMIAALLITAARRHFYRYQKQSAGGVDYAEPLTVREKLPKEKRKKLFQALDKSPAKRMQKLLSD